MAYGDSTISTDPNTDGVYGKTSVWDGNYVGVWHLPNGSSLTANDSTSKGHNASSIATPSPVAGKIDGGASFNGSSDNIIVNNSSDFNFTSGNFTVETWAYPNFTSGAANAIGFTNFTNRGWYINFDYASSQRISLHLIHASAGDRAIGSATNAWANGSWQSFAFVRTGTNTGALYTNGSSLTIATNNLADAGSETTENMYFGQGGNGSGYFTGYLDEIKISNIVRTADWIKTEYNNQNDPASFYTIGSEASIYHFNYSRSITIDHTKVGTVNNTDQTNFPVLVSLNNAALKDVAHGGKVQSANGYDIYFYSDSAFTTRIPAEIEKYDATNGILNAWVKVGTVSHTIDTTIYMAYGNAGISTDPNLDDTYGKTSVWDSNYKGVWHLPNGTSLSLGDSTSNALNLTNNGSYVTAVAGQIDGGANSPGTYSYATKASPGFTYTTGDTITIEAWIKRVYVNASTYYPALALSKSGGSTTVRNFELDFNGGGVGETTSNSITVHYRNSADTAWTAFWHTTADTDTTAWHHYAVTLTFGTGSTIAIYKDGVALTTASQNGNATPITAGVDTLYLLSADASEFLGGSADEVRLSKGIARSADWIATEYNNQSSPGNIGSPSFYTVSGESYLAHVNIRGGGSATNSNVKIRGGGSGGGSVKFR
jgi:hypothetical protein